MPRGPGRWGDDVAAGVGQTRGCGVELPGSAGHRTAAIGVRDLARERQRLIADWPDVPPTAEKPGVIAVIRLEDPDRNAVVLWQDLLDRRQSAIDST